MTISTIESKGNTINVGNAEELMAVRRKSGRCKMKWLITAQICTTILILLMIGTFYLVGYPLMKERQIITYITNITPNISEYKENIVTLYTLDPVASTFCFDDGKYGQIISDWSVYNRRSDIDFNHYKAGSFSVGIEGSMVGTIIDLGSSADLQQKYKYQETVGGGQGFASIHRKNNTIVILKGASYNHTFQLMEESEELFREGKSTASTSVKLGHVYLLRITDRNDAGFERIIKMLVISYTSSEWVTIRWEVLI
ncbi:unnamed protein product [Rotaria magnacalcarata]|uniref:Uncharacterized protein n=1 Tax=Rotaria magnacalcarata TaxID=392030 RepID=A0A815Q1I2_9BILA|nr:unnamed protein product [Rotaria magnacalcarata]CAF1642402.1 unnamed protein product [Rotaria magnacalcarata]CAF2066758.1 unnamed protein product [Rotaria magnacalcarata]CAF2158164.1 unnamed protein product [Rotaria magnacalcarata]CAF3806646.1 unnamed protein product [Rotaria magnacalcarata]